MLKSDASPLTAADISALLDGSFPGSSSQVLVFEKATGPQVSRWNLPTHTYAGIRRYLKQTASIPVRLTTMTTNEVLHAAAAPADASQPGQAQSPVATETRPVATEVAAEVAKEADAAADPVVGIVGYPAELLESGATWEQLGVDAAVIETVKKLTPPWDHPTQVQSQTIPSLLRGEDYIVQAPAGTGKTGTFVIAALAVLERSAGRATREEKRVELRELTVPQLTTLCGQLRLGKTGAKEELEENLCGAICELPRVVIVTSGQELVDQLKRDVAKLDPSIRVCRVKPEPNDMAEALSSMPNFAGFPVLAASIGKLAGLLNTQRAVLSNCTLFVADEADKLLNEHGSEFESIVKKLPPNCQRTFWSATIDDNTERKLKALTRDPRSAAVQRVDTGRMLTKNCANYKVSVASDDATAKYAVMDLISRFSGFQQMLVFANKREEADYISRQLGAQGWSVDSMHGKDDSREREKILKRFRNKEVTVLISTDILSRGLDCADLNCVVNWGMPRRSARALPSCRSPPPCALSFACAQAARWSHAVRRCDARKGFSGALTCGAVSARMGHAVRRYDARAFFVRRSTPALDVGRDGAAHDARLPCAPCPRQRTVCTSPSHPRSRPPPPPTRCHHIHTHRHMRALAQARAFARMHARTHMPTAPVRPHTLITYVLQICRAFTAHIPKAVGSTWRPMSSESFAAAVCLGKPKHSASSKRVRET